MEVSRRPRSPPVAAEIELHLTLDKTHQDEADDSLVAPQSTLAPNDYQTKSKPSLFADDFRRLSISPAPSGRLSPVPHGPNKPSILVAVSQFFGALMNLSARLLELDGDGIHPVQVLLLRQGLTVVCCFVYMWWKNIPDFPFGKKEIRGLLLIRGFSGFFGIYGMWYSMMYLPLADATVITFLAPGVAGLLCYFALHEPFTRPEQIATAVALLGVILIARPVSLFTALSPSDEQVVDSPEQVDGAFPSLEHEPTAEERLMAVGVALLGVLGAAGAFTCIRTIGKRAHPLISVNFFGMACTIICVLALTLAPTLNVSQPHLRWITPKSWKGWFLLLWIAVPGFIMQYLLTSGLAADTSNRANAMIYTHMLFAVSFDRWIFGHSMSMMSFAGCALILGSAITVVLTKNPPARTGNDIERQGNVEGEAEGSPMLIDTGGNVEEINLRRT
ncbi:hypothetical protein TrVFT333_008323 [Trichoderma virens FT-333]|nr:hypothetical protein TrVFT333_008323 [Trichoderma virens FT-333]